MFTFDGGVSVKGKKVGTSRFCNPKIPVFIAGILTGICLTIWVCYILVEDEPDTETVRPQLLGRKSGAPIKSASKSYWVESISDAPGPRMSLIHNLVTPEEAEHLKSLGLLKGMEKALIIPYGGKDLIESTTRTNTAAWLDFNQDPVVTKVEQAYAEITGLPAENGENLQILRYQSTQQFREHHDYFDPAEDPPENFEPGGNRVATFVLYLQNSDVGGETEFVKINQKFKPAVGDALLFWDVTPDGKVDPRTIHAATPAIGGEKWVATKWIHERRYQGMPRPSREDKKAAR